jgi:hypothetical protein
MAYSVVPRLRNRLAIMSVGVRLSIMLVNVAILGAGLYALLRPEKLQAYAISNSVKWNPYLPWMKSRSYVWTIRLMGGMAVLCAALVLAMGLSALLVSSE